MSTLSPFDHPVFRPYFVQVREWHGYIRLLGLPTLKDNPDVAIQHLFVAPELGESYIPADSDQTPKGSHIFERLARNKRQIVLGDPGSGKSTLINWLAWRLTAGLADPLPECLQNAIPIPMVLREMDLRAVVSFDGLMQAFLDRPVAQPLAHNLALIKEKLAVGQVLILIDGLDEVPEHQQAALRRTLIEGLAAYPESCWVISSRVVGYTDINIEIAQRHAEMNPNSSGISTRELSNDDLLKQTFAGGVLGALAGAVIPSLGVGKGALLGAALATNEGRSVLSALANTQLLRQPIVETCYALPFDETRIRGFAHSWYSLRSSTAQAGATAENFLAALRRDSATWHLARNPQLLTLMALVFRSRLQLPEGRALLYEDIAQAYLESIDTSRGLINDHYPWKEKKRWLGRVAFEMQLRRAELPDAAESSGKDLLFTEKDVLDWIALAMDRSGYPCDKEYCADYLSHIARRSGLLIPRGEGLYAFLHLSFQEYFAGYYLREQLCSPIFAAKQTAKDPRLTLPVLQKWPSSQVWREVLIFLFELVGQDADWAEALDDWFFGHLESVPNEPTLEITEPLRLHLQLALNPHTGLPKSHRDQACRQTFNAITKWGLLNDGFTPSSIAGESVHKLRNSLLRTEQGQELAISVWANTPPDILDLSELGQYLESIVRRLPHQVAPIWLNLSVNHISDLNWLAPIFANTEALFLIGNTIGNLEPLCKAPALTDLNLHLANITDISGLSKLSQLRELDLGRNPINDIDALSGLTNIERLDLRSTQITDIKPLRYCRNLISLDISATAVSDLSPLEGLQSLETLHLENTHITRVEPLSGCIRLTKLDLGNTSITDLSPLMKLPKLRITGIPQSVPEDQRRFFEERKNEAHP